MKPRYDNDRYIHNNDPFIIMYVILCHSDFCTSTAIYIITRRHETIKFCLITSKIPKVQFKWKRLYLTHKDGKCILCSPCEFSSTKY